MLDTRHPSRLRLLPTREQTPRQCMPYIRPPLPTIDASSSEADGTDADAVRINLDSGLFPGIDSSITVHRGFADTQAECVSK